MPGPTAANHVHVMRSEGQRMLLAVTGTLTAIANEIGAKHNMISAWRSGDKMPSAPARARMQEAFGIPVKAWTLRPGGTMNDEPTLEAVASPSTLEGCLALLTVIQRNRAQPGLMPSELVKLAFAEARILQLRALLEQAAELAESRYVVGHPSWLRLRRAIVVALEPYPQAAQAVLDVIVKVETG